MWRFYLEYCDVEKLRHLVAEIGWSSSLLIINKIKDVRAREYYLQAVVEMGLTPFVT